MYLPEKEELYNDEEEHRGEMMMLPQSQAQAHAILTESSGEDPEVRAPKKRAETWIHEETLALIGFRREMDRLFNTSKSNRHLWEQISSKMRDRGYDRSPTMCTDKWRNLLKEYKKLRHHDRVAGGGGGSSKLSCYKELGELLRERTKNDSGGSGNNCKSPISAAKIDAFLHFPDKGLEDSTLTFGPVEDSSRSALNVERGLEHAEHHTLALTAADAVAANGVPPWNWRDPVANGGDSNASYGGRVISVKWGDYTRRIGIDGTADAIKEAIKSAFGLRTRRAFWLEDEDEVVRSLDRDMPLGIYTLHLDEGVTIKVCFYDDPDRLSVRTENKILYTEEDLQEFLKRRGWAGLRELSGFRTVDTLDELRQGAVYQGVRHLGDP